MIDQIQLRRALLDVYDKEGPEELATALHAAGVELVSTGPTATWITATGIPMTPIKQLARFPECLDSHVKTLHSRIHAGILADRRSPAHISQLEKLGIAPLDLVVASLYPFEATVASGAGTDECVEQIDISRSSMVRTTVKDHPGVAVVTSTSQYPAVLAAPAEGGLTFQRRRGLATETFRHTASYNIAVTS